MSASTTTPTATWQTVITGYRSVPTLVGETILQYALRVTGDAGNWTDIVQLNSLVWPFLVSDQSLIEPGVALAGQDSLKVVSASPSVSGVSDPGDVYGTDWLIEGGDFVVSPSGDFQTVSGPANLDQAVKTKLIVRLLDLIRYPTFGCGLYRLLGQGAAPTNNQLAAAYVSSAVSADPRISSIDTCTATITGDICDVDMTAVAVDGRKLPVGTKLSTTSPTVGLTST